jgi:hypothetical protein
MDENATAMLSFRVYPGVKRALEKMQGPNKSMRATFEGVLMGYTNEMIKWFAKARDEALADIAQEQAVLESQKDKDVINSINDLLAHYEENLKNAETNLARYIDIQNTAFPNHAVNDKIEGE